MGSREPQYGNNDSSHAFFINRFPEGTRVLNLFFMYKKVLHFAFFILAISAVFLSSCSSKDSPEVTSIKLSANTMSLKVGESSKLTVSYLPSNLETPIYTWSSSNESVATVKNGNITAIAEGTVTITVSASGLGLSDACTVSVSPITPTSVTLDMVKDTVIVGQSFTLTATVSPQNAKDKTVAWSSSNENVASVSSTGVVQTKSAGTTIITVTTQSGGFTATCTVTVKPDNNIKYNPYGNKEQW
jgi:uncharacterized protein YjdB